MNADKATVKFRKELARKYKLLLQVLRNLGLNHSSLSQAISELANDSYLPAVDGKTSPRNWGYDIDGFVFEADVKGAVQYPKKTTRIKITLGLRLVAEYSDEQTTISDPLKYLAFNLTVEGYNKQSMHFMSYHLDRHIEGGNEPDEAHPIYHFQFGGNKLKELDDQNFGRSIFLDAPRLMHYPMDLIMGIDFVTSNFMPSVWQKLRNDPTFVGLLEESQKMILKPYFHTLASHYDGSNYTSSSWDCKSICPHLV